MALFDNEYAAQRKAAEELQKKGQKLAPKDRDRAERKLAGRLEKRYDKWTRDNVGLN
jgi:hypothetical protein